MFFIQIGIIFCMLTVIIGAFGAHSLESTIGDKMDTFKTGIQYQIFHGIALIITGILSKGRIGAEQVVQNDVGKTTDCFLGNRYMQTLAKLPIESPKINRVTVINGCGSVLISSILH